MKISQTLFQITPKTAQGTDSDAYFSPNGEALSIVDEKVNRKTM